MFPQALSQAFQEPHGCLVQGMGPSSLELEGLGPGAPLLAVPAGAYSPKRHTLPDAVAQTYRPSCTHLQTQLHTRTDALPWALMTQGVCSMAPACAHSPNWHTRTDAVAHTYRHRCTHLQTQLHTLTDTGALTNRRICTHSQTQVHSLTDAFARTHRHRCTHLQTQLHTLTDTGALTYRPICTHSQTQVHSLTDAACMHSQTQVHSPTDAVAHTHRHRCTHLQAQSHTITDTGALTYRRSCTHSQTQVHSLTDAVARAHRCSCTHVQAMVHAYGCIPSGADDPGVSVAWPEFRV